MREYKFRAWNDNAKVVLRMGLRVGDKIEVNYPVDDFSGHVGIVREIKESTEFPGKTI